MKVSVFERKDRPGSWKATWREAGKSKSKVFASRREAQAWAKRKEKETNEYGFSISEQERLLLLEMRQVGWSVKAVQSLIRARSPVSSTITVEDSVNAFIDDAMRRNLRKKTIQHYESACSHFVEYYGKDRLLGELGADDVVKYITDRYSNEASRKNIRAGIRTWLNWEAAQEHIDSNIPKNIAWRASVEDEVSVGYLSVDDAEALIRAVPEKYQAAIALQMFAGVRPFEVIRMDWAAVNWSTSVVDIDGKVAKTRRFRRLHDLPDNLWLWLEASPGKEGPLVQANWRNYAGMMRKAREAAGVKSWTQDALRHTFGSYAYHLGLEWAVDTMGHVAGFRTFVKHYKGAASAADAEKYFQILPL